jgi:hypothetical protein
MLAPAPLRHWIDSINGRGTCSLRIAFSKYQAIWTLLCATYQISISHFSVSVIFRCTGRFNQAMGSAR